MKNLREIVKEKILILDGAMGTEIQKYNLTEEDFRGERFRDLPGMMKGNNDMLNITRPDVISDIYRRYLELAPILLQRILFRASAFRRLIITWRTAPAKWHSRVPDWHVSNAISFSTPDKPRFVCRRCGTNQQDLLHESGRQQSCRS